MYFVHVSVFGLFSPQVLQVLYFRGDISLLSVVYLETIFFQLYLLVLLATLGFGFPAVPGLSPAAAGGAALSSGTRTVSRAPAQQLWHMGLGALRYVASSWTRIKPMCSALAGGFVITVSPEKCYNIWSHVFRVVLQTLKPPADGRS